MLSPSQIDILRYHAEAGDRIAYYTTLSAFGVAYGTLALQVVLNNSVAGAGANNYFLNMAMAEVGSITADQLATVSRELMLADFSRRARHQSEESESQVL